MKPFVGKCLVALGLAVFVAFQPPSTARAQLFGLSPEEESRLGAEQHPIVVKENGGVYDNPEIQAYIAQITGRLVANSDTPRNEFRVTVLNTPEVNAFALPGGYVYITRGLLALANNEAEVAGVMGHEIGHVTARHISNRISQANTANIFTGLVGIAGALFGVPEVGDLVAVGSQFYLASFSREQEHEADLIGVRILAKTGYAPQAQASFLDTLGRWDEFQQKLWGAPDRFNLLATHPRSSDRVERAIAEANAYPPSPIYNRDEYLKAVEGLLVDDDPAQGLVKPNGFYHPDLQIAIGRPESFRIVNTQDSVMFLGPQGQRARFDMESNRNVVRRATRLENYVTQVWGRELNLSDVEGFTVNGHPAATAWTRVRLRDGSTQDLRLVAIRARDQIYRFFMLTGPRLRLREADRVFQPLVNSFRTLSDQEAAAIKPHRLRVVTVKPGDTVRSLASTMPYDEMLEERFRVLNKLDPNAQLEIGARVKLVVETD